MGIIKFVYTKELVENATLEELQRFCKDNRNFHVEINDDQEVLLLPNEGEE